MKRVLSIFLITLGSIGFLSPLAAEKPKEKAWYDRILTRIPYIPGIKGTSYLNMVVNHSSTPYIAEGSGLWGNPLKRKIQAKDTEDYIGILITPNTIIKPLKNKTTKMPIIHLEDTGKKGVAGNCPNKMERVEAIDQHNNEHYTCTNKPWTRFWIGSVIIIINEDGTWNLHSYDEYKKEQAAQAQKKP